MVVMCRKCNGNKDIVQFSATLLCECGVVSFVLCHSHMEMHAVRIFSRATYAYENIIIVVVVAGVYNGNRIIFYVVHYVGKYELRACVCVCELTMAGGSGGDVGAGRNARKENQVANSISHADDDHDDISENRNKYREVCVVYYIPLHLLETCHHFSQPSRNQFNHIRYD